MEFLGNFQMFKQKAKLYTILQVWNFLKTYPCSKLVKIIIFGMLGSLQRLSVYLHCIWKTRGSWWKASVHKRKKKISRHHLFLYSIGLHCKRESPTEPLIHGYSCFAFCVWYNFRKRTLVVKGWGRGWQFALHDLTEMLQEGSSVLPRDSFYRLEINTLGKTRLQKRIQNYKYEIRSRAWKGPQWVKGL